MNDVNRLLIAFVAGVWIVLMSMIIFLAWAAPDDTIDRLGDFVEYLAAHNTSNGKLIVTCAAAASAIGALLVVIAEFAPEDEIRELRVEQAGATTIVPAGALRARLEEALLELPSVSSAKAKVWTRDRGVAAVLDIVVPPTTNVASVTQEAVRVVIDAVQTDLGLPVSGVPVVKVTFDGHKPKVAPPAEDAPRFEEVPETPPPPPAGLTPAQESHADASPGPLIYDETPPPAHTPPPTHTPPRSLDAPDDDRT